MTHFNETDGMTHSRIYGIFRQLLSRCNDKNVAVYQRYGGRGIKCTWKSFEEFRDEMYESYLEHCNNFGEKNTTLDRINNDGNYATENCRWATYKEQGRNKRKHLVITYKGESKCLAA